VARIDLNADLGEGFGDWELGDDDGLLSIVTSASIACGFHAGDPARMLRTARAAASHRVTIGAHVAYPDLRGFGRREIGAPPAEIHADVLYQIGALQAVCAAVGTRVGYVKPHGALYHRVLRDRAAADAVVAAMVALDPALMLLTTGGSEAASAAAAAGLGVAAEGFADRAYQDDGSLVPRSEAGAVLADPAAVTAQAVRLAAGSMDSLCVHGDTPGAVRLAGQVRMALEAAGLTVGPFTSP
jgi:UPF0271 protein